MVPAEVLKKPEWIRVKAGSPSTRFYEIKHILRENKLSHGVRGSQLPEHRRMLRQGHGHLHDHGRQVHAALPVLRRRPRPPDPLDVDEPANLAKTIAALKLKYVVITSVDRDDLRDGGAAHFVECIRKTRELSPATQIEVLVPDFRGRDDRALEILKAAPPDVMNHNLETVPRLYKQARPGSDYAFSLNLLKKFKALHPGVPTKSGLMVGLGETDDEILDRDARHARARHRDADHRPVPRAQRPPPAGAPLRASRHLQDVRARGRRRWASRTPRSARWCVRATTPTSRPTPLACWRHRALDDLSGRGTLAPLPPTDTRKEMHMESHMTDLAVDLGIVSGRSLVR